LEKLTRVLVSTITYNRPKGLKRLLQALQQQQVDRGLQVEILVVDNDCSGENPKVVAALTAAGAPIKMHLVEAREKGIVPARNKAVEYLLASDFQALVFIDDDEWPGQNSWLQTLVNTQQQTQADVVTSVLHVLAENPQDKWIEKVPGFGTHNQTKVEPIDRFYTANVLIMRHVLEVVRPAFDMRFAFTGSSDLHFSIKCRHAGFKAVVTPFAPVQENYPTTRTNLRWFFLRGYRSGEGATRANIYEGSFPKAYLLCLVMFGFRLVRGVVNGLRGVFTWQKAYIALSFLQVGSALGTLGGFLGISYQEYKTIHGS
jgi:glycosyltransferase involved in cell wall biosynthesis